MDIGTLSDPTCSLLGLVRSFPLNVFEPVNMHPTVSDTNRSRSFVFVLELCQ